MSGRFLVHILIGIQVEVRVYESVEVDVDVQDNTISECISVRARRSIRRRMRKTVSTCTYK